jgi:hypothetical protein
MGLLYDSSLMADVDCYELLLDGTPTGVVELPVEWIRDDAVYFNMNRFASLRPHTAPADVFDIFRRELEAAYREGGIFQLTMHPHIIGYRSRVWIIEELIRHARALGPIWFATHADIVLDQDRFRRVKEAVREHLDATADVDLGARRQHATDNCLLHQGCVVTEMDLAGIHGNHGADGHSVAETQTLGADEAEQTDAAIVADFDLVGDQHRERCDLRARADLRTA